MTEQDKQDDVARIVLKLVQDDPDMQIDNLSMVHPMHEALIALFKQQLSDREIVAALAKNDDKDSLRKVLFVDALLSLQKPPYADDMKKSLMAGASVDDIIAKAALHIAEDRRVQQGTVLRCVQSEAGNEDYFMRALKTASPAQVYLTESEIVQTKCKAETMREHKWRRPIAAVALAGALLVGGYVWGRQSVETQKKDPSTNALTSTNAIAPAGETAYGQAVSFRTM